MDIKYPWDKGNDGWENYSDFESWLADQLDESNEEWVSDAPTALLTVFCRFADEIEKQVKTPTPCHSVDKYYVDYDM